MKMNRTLSVAFVWSLLFFQAFSSSAYAMPIEATSSDPDYVNHDEVVCENPDSIVDEPIRSLSDEELESFFQSSSPEFATAFNDCVDGGGDTSVCADTATEVALFTTAQEVTSDQEPTTPQAPKKTPEELRAQIREKMRRRVFEMVNAYWKEQDMKEYGYWDQDGDGIADRLDRDSYTGRGQRPPSDYTRPIPGARADGQYNCEYFSQYFRQGFVAVFYDENRENNCWKIEYQGHAVNAFCYNFMGDRIYVYIEPQGGSSYFISRPTLPLEEMPGRGESGTVGEIRCYNCDKNSWTDNTRPDASLPRLSPGPTLGGYGEAPIVVPSPGTSFSGGYMDENTGVPTADYFGPTSPVEEKSIDYLAPEMTPTFRIFRRWRR